MTLKTGVKMLKIQLYITEINENLQYIQINVGLVSIIVFQKYSNILLTPDF